MSNFDFIAPIYDSIAKVVYGNKLRAAQSHFLHYIKSKQSVLIVGGGAGWILTEFKDSSVSIDYVEQSSKMIQIAQQRECEASVNFIHSSEIPTSKKYDVVITPFVLDCFPSDRLKAFVLSIDQQVKHEGAWICVDFNSEDKRFISKLLARMMIVFFRIVAKLPTSQLDNYFSVIECIGYQSIDYQLFVGGFVKASLLKKYNL